MGTIVHYRAFGVFLPLASERIGGKKMEVFTFWRIAEQIPMFLIENNGWVNQR